MSRTLNQSSLVGSWDLLEHSMFKPGAHGILLYHPDGSMAVVIRGELLKTQEEKVIAYAGEFKVAGLTVEHHVKVAERSTRVGRVEVRDVLLEKNILKLSFANPDGAAITVQWQKR